MSIPSKLEMFVSEIQKTGKSSFSGAVNAMTVRVPTCDFARIEALTSHSGMPRNTVICNLLEIALDQVFSELNLENSRAVNSLSSEISNKLLVNEQGELRSDIDWNL
jgi:hypothetical protein